MPKRKTTLSSSGLATASRTDSEHPQRLIGSLLRSAQVATIAFQPRDIAKRRRFAIWIPYGAARLECLIQALLCSFVIFRLAVEFAQISQGARHHVTVAGNSVLRKSLFEMIPGSVAIPEPGIDLAEIAERVRLAIGLPCEAAKESAS